MIWIIAAYIAGIYIGIGIGLCVPHFVDGEMRAPRMLGVILLWPVLLIIP